MTATLHTSSFPALTDPRYPVSRMAGRLETYLQTLAEKLRLGSFIYREIIDKGVEVYAAAN